MAYTLKATGIAANLVACVGVDDDNTTITDFKGNGITAGTGVAASVTTSTWKGSTRGYFVTTANGSFNFNGITWNATLPSVDETDADGMSVWFACAGASSMSSTGAFVQLDSGNTYGLSRSTASGPITYRKGGGTRAIGATSLPTDGSTHFSVGYNYESASDSEAFYGLESGSLASDGTAGSDGGFGTSASELVAIGGISGQGNQPFKPFIVCVFNRKLTLAEMQSLHDDWVGTLFEGGTSLVGAAAYYYSQQ